MTMDVIYKERRSDWSRQVSAVVTTQRLQGDQIIPPAKGVACETNITLPLFEKGVGCLQHLQLVSG